MATTESGHRHVPAPTSAAPPPRKPVRRLLHVLGPGLITGASDDDPSGIVTYAIAGASLGLTLLWTALFALPLMTAIQYISAKIGLASGTGLTRAIRDAYGRTWPLYPIALLLFIANTINLGADLGAIAAALNLVLPVPARWLIPPITLVLIALLLLGSYGLIATVFKWLTLALFAYVGAALLAHPNAQAALKATIIPQVGFSRGDLTTLVAILGTTISPYMWFWQASEEVEEEVSAGRVDLAQRRGASDRTLTNAFLDTFSGMFVSNVVMYFIILAAAVTLHQAGKTDITSARDAAEALRPLAGNLSSLLFTVGIVGAGMLAVPILAGSAAYAVGDAFGWRVGLDRRLSRARLFYAVIVMAMLAGMGLNYLGISPITLLFATAVIFGLLAPPLMVVLMLLANHPTVVGNHPNGWLANGLGWLATVVMAAAAIALLVTL